MINPRYLVDNEGFFLPLILGDPCFISSDSKRRYPSNKAPIALKFGLNNNTTSKHQRYFTDTR
jgi:hypothetical protein